MPSSAAVMFSSLRDTFTAAPADGGNMTVGALIQSKSRPTLTGYLIKEGGVVKSWKRRFFILHESTLYYYRDNNRKVSMNLSSPINDENANDFVNKSNAAGHSTSGQGEPARRDREHGGHGHRQGMGASPARDISLRSHLARSSCTHGLLAMQLNSFRIQAADRTYYFQAGTSHPLPLLMRS